MLKYLGFPDIYIYRITMEATKAAAFGMIVAALFINIILYPHVPPHFLVVWNLLFLMTWGLRIGANRLFLLFNRLHEERYYRISQAVFLLSLFFASVLWASDIYYLDLLSPTHRYMLYAVVIALTFGGTMTIGAVTPLFIIFSAPMNLILAVRFFANGTLDGVTSALFLLISYFYSLKIAKIIKKHYLLLIENVSRIKIAKDFYEKRANYDALSGLPNRMRFHEMMRDALKEADRTQTRIALLFIDLTKFKQINDTYGHAAGDKVIKIVGKRLKNAIREGDIAARFAGDEFVVALRHIDPDTPIRPIVQKLYDVLSKPLGLGEGLTVTVIPSIGVVIYPDHHREIDTLIHYADTAMYESKESGAPFVIYSPQTKERISDAPKKS
ncbi:MAG: GGDEF domain-containing protein [Epsilonproteobacteria bacterium]|nr:GGDEF domain-containing protein [Campylobacterota bacterium]